MTTIRLARPGRGEIIAMIHELAAFENAADECTVTELHITAALFGTMQRVASCLSGRGRRRHRRHGLQWFATSPPGTVAGIHLEDLYVREEFRKRLARPLLSTLARECVHLRTQPAPVGQCWRGTATRYSYTTRLAANNFQVDRIIASRAQTGRTGRRSSVNPRLVCVHGGPEVQNLTASAQSTALDV